ncbi:MAG TPA: ATP-dependent DNA ligase [Arthrobacter sp.]
MSGELPADLRVPSLAMAKPVARVPSPGLLPGGCLYEPKWDGFRCGILVEESGVTIWSRQGKDLTRYFPDLVAAFAGQVPAGCVLDGEALIWTGDRLDFNSLQARLTTARRSLPALVKVHPASFAAFDILAVAGHDTRGLILSDRRALLEELSAGWAPPLNLSPATSDYATALEWFEDFPATGIEGLVIKGAAQKYEGGVRQWLKVKHRDNIDVVCAAVIGRRDAPYALVVGLPMFGRLWIVGATSALGRSASRHLAMHLHSPRPDHPWPDEISPTVIDRYTSRKDPIRLTRVEPLVVEVSADVAWSGRSFRHPLRYLRARPELDPAAVQLPEYLSR